MIIEEVKLQAWMDQLRQGERLHLHRSEQRALLDAIFAYRVMSDGLTKEVADLRRQNEALQVQIHALNETVSIVARRGDRTGGLPDPDEPIHDFKHGSVFPWFASWGPETIMCDWGNCNKPATKGRFDQYGFGWLPCCTDCAGKDANGP